MKTTRFCLLLGAAILLVGSITGCLTVQQSVPQALFTASPVEQVIPFTASFDGTLSYNPDGEIASYLWTFGDGGADNGPLVDHTYTQDGIYEVRLTVIDEKGLSTSSTITVQALNPLPQAGFSYTPKSNMQGVDFVSCSETITFDATDMCSDDGEIVSYEWYFGYRDVTTNEPITAEGPVVTHKFLYAATYNIGLTVTDDDGGVTTYIEPLVVKGGPPCNADVTGDVPWNYVGTCQ